MKFILAILVVAVALGSNSAVFIGRGIGGFGGRFGGRLGFGGLGFGGLGLGLGGFGLGFPFGGLGLLGLGMPWGGLGLLGKRDVSAIQKEFEMSNVVTECKYFADSNVIKCAGDEKTEIECSVKPEFITWTPTETTHLIKNLTALPENTQVKEDIVIFNLFSFDKKTAEINDFTFLDTTNKDKQQKVEFSLFFKAGKTERPSLTGLRFTEEVCWSKFVKLVGSSMPGNVRVDLHFGKHHETEKTIE